MFLVKLGIIIVLFYYYLFLDFRKVFFIDVDDIFINSYWCKFYVE